MATLFISWCVENLQIRSVRNDVTSGLVWGMRQTGVMLIGHEVQLNSGIGIAAQVPANSCNRPGNYFLLTPILGYPQLLAILPLI